MTGFPASSALSRAISLKRKGQDQHQDEKKKKLAHLPGDLGYLPLQFSYLGVVCFVQSGE